MTKPGITYSNVASAAKQLKKANLSITIDNIRHILGTGSKTTISRHLKVWKTKQNSAEISIHKIIGSNIKLHRIKAGYTQAQLAKKLKIERSSITNIELGNQKLSVDKLLLMSELFRIDISILVNTDIQVCPTCGQPLL